MLSCWQYLFFLFCLLLFYFFLPSMGWLCGVRVFGLIECSHSLPAFHCGLQLIIIIDNGSNNTVGGSYYSAHQAVSRFPEHSLIWSVAFIANAKLELV